MTRLPEKFIAKKYPKDFGKFAQKFGEKTCEELVRRDMPHTAWVIVDYSSCANNHALVGLPTVFGLSFCIFPVTTLPGKFIARQSPKDFGKFSQKFGERASEEQVRRFTRYISNSSERELNSVLSAGKQPLSCDTDQRLSLS